MTKKEIMKKLEGLGVEFNPKESKDDLDTLLSDTEIMLEEEKIEEVEDKIEELEEDNDIPVDKEIDEDPAPAPKEKEDTYAGKKILKRQIVKINGIEREMVLLESMENIIL